MAVGAAHFNINTGITNQQPFISLFYPSPLLSLCFILLETMGSHNDKRHPRCDAEHRSSSLSIDFVHNNAQIHKGGKCWGRSDGAKRHFNSTVCLFPLKPYLKWRGININFIYIASLTMKISSRPLRLTPSRWWNWHFQSLWHNRSAQSAVHRKGGGSSPSRDGTIT